MARYTYYYTKREDGTPHKIICVSSFAGKSVRGVAACMPGDNFNLEIGKKFAKLRCDLKIAERRSRKAEQDYKVACEGVAQATKLLDKKTSYRDDSRANLINTKKLLDDFVEKLAKE